MKITFLGAVQGVTGSRTIVEDDSVRILVDCGLFQSEDSFDQANFLPFPVDPQTIDALIITHAHIDHTGYIPVLVKQGFLGPIYCSGATFALCKILLLDSAMIQEEDAERINFHRKQDQKEVEPLYTVDDTEKALQLFKPVSYDTSIILGAVQIKLIRSGHILGSSFVEITDGTTKLVFSGDLGRPEQDIMKPPPLVSSADYLVLESTYGNRLHNMHLKSNPLQELKGIIEQTVRKRGILLIPAFAVGRTQIILYYLFQLRRYFPSIPIFLDSPMAINVTDLYCTFHDEHALSSETCTNAFNVATYVRKVKDSKKLNDLDGPAIIIAGSGMASGGRIIAHLRQRIADKKNTVLFVGYQAAGTLGRKLVSGAKEVRIYGQDFSVKAQIASLENISAHADYTEILAWLAGFKKPIKAIFLNHGEEDAKLALKEKIEQQFGGAVTIPEYKESFTLE